ncbi:30S ribosome-binding factor RbfA [Adhaeretor mobilis]|uniref:Ribosome-binding factor A n=1 Tax=Adhaeretor mobilis TaxID=1930276 RepID=A0A517N002_9BACT|nr:30S ribosome-binding factor RbfA [Adhaeretor mobilis]QDT00461.1 Ribosome-binding factor A [Adhaeretor mobilis]
MSSRRVLKAAQAIREVVGMAILADLKDPRIENATITKVEVAPDMRQAKVSVSVMGDDAKQRLCVSGLQSAAGYLQSKIAKRIDTRYTPRLKFELDMGVKKSIELAKVLDEVLPPEDLPPTESLDARAEDTELEELTDQEEE